MQMALLLVMILISLCKSPDQLIVIEIIVLSCIVIYKLFIEHFIEAYSEYKNNKKQELAKKECEQEKVKLEKQKRIESTKRYKTIKKHANQVYSDIINGKYPMLNFEEIMYEHLDVHNPKIITFCKKNNITINDLIVIQLISQKHDN